MSVFDSIRDSLFKRAGGEESLPEKITDAQEQPKEDQDLCGFVKNKVEDVRGHANRVSNEGIWMTNIAYLLGFDSVYYDPTMRQFRPLGGMSGFVKRNRVHENILLPAAQNRLARMCKSPPKYDVRPNSMSEEDKEAARLGVETINMVWDRQAINKKRIELFMWKQQCGHSYMTVGFDPEIGEPLVDPISGDILGFEGEIRVDPVSAFEVFCDPLAKTLDEASWVARAKVRKLEYFRQQYPDRGEAVKQEGAWLLSTQYEQRINTLNTVGPASSGSNEQMQNAAIEISYYERRSKKYPNGRHVITANGVLLKNDDLPYGEIPLVKFDDIVVAGKFYSETPVTHARPLQDQYNRALSKRAEWVNKLLAGKYIAAKGHGLAQEALNDRTEVVEYNPVPGSTPPTAMQIPQMPEYAYKECADLKNSVWDEFGLSEISRGKLPSASIPAQGMEILLEQDETRIGIEVENDEYAWAKVGQLILKCADKNYITPRNLKKRAKDSNYQIKQFTGESLRKNFDVIVIRGSTLPNNKVVKRQEILNVYNAGLYGNPQDPVVREKVLGMLEYGDDAGIWEDYRLDMAQIDRTIKQLELGEPVEVNKLDNHALHVAIKNRYRKSDKWDGLPPEIQMNFLMNIEAHVNEGAALANPQLFGAPPDPGPPPLTLDEMEQGSGVNVDSLIENTHNISTGGIQ